MLQLLSLIQCPRLKYQPYPLITNALFRNMCCGCKKSGCNCDSKNKEKEQTCDCTKGKDETAIKGGSACEKNKDDKEDKCLQLLFERESKKDKKDDDGKCGPKVSGGGPRCPPKPCEKPEPVYEKSTRWKKITLLAALPLVAMLTAFVFTSHHEKERPEFKKWAHMYHRNKPFYFGDGLRTAFHNSYWNPLPPEGYEDEIDLDAIGKTPETEKERADRLKEFASVQKVWKKHDANREAVAKKAQAAAEKEAQRQQKEAEKEEKRQQAEQAKELKRLQAEEAKELKRQEEEAKKELKREEAEMKKLENDAKQTEFPMSEKNENEKDK